VDHCTSNLHRIGALLQAHDLAALQGPNWAVKSSRQLSPGRGGSPGRCTRSPDSRNAEAHGDEVLVVLEETTKEAAEYVVEANVDTAVRKARI
jgi:hypothetical protein